MRGILSVLHQVKPFAYNLRKKSEVFRLEKEYMTYNEVSISQFDEGNAIQIFDRLSTDRGLVVLKNGQQIAVILLPEEYTRLVEVEEDYKLAVEVIGRLEEKGEEPTIPFEEIFERLKIGEDTL